MAAIEFRAFLVMDNKVARQEMVENGGKWQKMDFRVFYAVIIEVAGQAMAENGLKWVAAVIW